MYLCIWEAAQAKPEPLLPMKNVPVGMCCPQEATKATTNREGIQLNLKCDTHLPVFGDDPADT